MTEGAATGNEIPADILDQARAAAGASAEVRATYGGLEITVLDDAGFPWAPVLRILTDAGQDVWVRASGEKLEIRSKAPAV